MPLAHSEFLALPYEDPRHDLITRLLDDIPENACVITYTNFETKRLRELGGWFPECRERIEDVLRRVRDISQPFNRMVYYHWQMNGSYSIKTVLPHLDPEMSYEGLEIRNGEMAKDAYVRMNESQDSAETERIRTALLEYCRLDTVAMVRILDKFRPPDIALIFHATFSS